MAKRYSAKFKFQVVMEVLTGDKSQAQVAKAYGVHRNTVRSWKKSFLKKGPEVFAKDSVVSECERLSWPKSTSVLQLCADALLCATILASRPYTERVVMSLLHQRVSSLHQAVEQRLRKWTMPENHGPVLNAALDLTPL